MRELGSFAVFALVSFFFMPVIRRQNAARRLAFSGDAAASACLTGGLMSLPAARNEARPLAFSPPSGSWPSFRCHAAVRGTSVFLVLVVVFALEQRQLGLEIADLLFQCGDFVGF